MRRMLLFMVFFSTACTGGQSKDAPKTAFQANAADRVEVQSSLDVDPNFDPNFPEVMVDFHNLEGVVLDAPMPELPPQQVATSPITPPTTPVEPSMPVDPSTPTAPSNAGNSGSPVVTAPAPRPEPPEVPARPAPPISRPTATAVLVAQGMVSGCNSGRLSFGQGPGSYGTITEVQVRPGRMSRDTLMVVTQSASELMSRNARRASGGDDGGSDIYTVIIKAQRGQVTQQVRGSRSEALALKASLLNSRQVVATAGGCRNRIRSIR